MARNKRRESRRTLPDSVKASRGTAERDGESAPVRGWRWYFSLAAVPLVLLVVAAFYPCLSNGFVDWDDHVNFLRNTGYRGLGWSQLRWD
jgi:hypothetical protein